MKYWLILLVLAIIVAVVINDWTKRPTIDSLIQKGWFIDDKNILMPPDEKRRGWGSVWNKMEHQGRTIFVPHYAGLKK